MSLIEQWANNVGVTGTLNGSWIEAIAVKKYNLDLQSGNTLLSIKLDLAGEGVNTGDLYHDIAIGISGNSYIDALNGSYLERIVELTNF